MLNATAQVDAAIETTLKLEAGYVNNPNDRGGPTRWGVTEVVARSEGYKGDMRDLPRETAKQILLQRYWQRPGFDAVNRLSPAIAWEMFDAGVLSGPALPVIWLQKALRLLNMSHKTPLFPDVKVDGSMGKTPETSETIKALSAYLTARKRDGQLILLRMLNCQQGAYFMDITDKRVQNEEFINGWFLNRVTI